MLALNVQRWEDGAFSSRDDDLADEEPLEIRVQDHPISVTMRTPGRDIELAAGFLLTEGIIRRAQDIARIEQCVRNKNVIRVTTDDDLAIDFKRLTRHVFASSSCGVCGKATIDAVHAQFPPIAISDFGIDPEIITQLPDKMRQRQVTFNRTGGLHAAALFDALGNLIVLREDVGRHNAVDKVIGHALLNQLFPLDRCMLLVSGRTSFEILQKALAGRLPIVAAVSAPSSLAVEFANANQQTLIGFLRDRRMNIYTHAHRLQAGAETL